MPLKDTRDIIREFLHDRHNGVIPVTDEMVQAVIDGLAEGQELNPVSRSSELLRAAAEALEDGRDPLTTPFLSENEVTLDECYDMADSLALGALLVSWAMDNPRQAVIAARGAGDSLRMDAITRLLAKINAEG